MNITKDQRKDLYKCSRDPMTNEPNRALTKMRKLIMTERQKYEHTTENRDDKGYTA
jgi:hypothetical protein